MAQRVHTYKLTAAFGPAEILRALESFVEHPAHREAEPKFEFDWMARRVALSANSREGLAECHRVFTGLMRKAGAGDDSLLAGPVREVDGRFVQPYGVTVHDAATFGELIGQALVEVGVRGVQVVDSSDCCRINVRVNSSMRVIDSHSLITEFPLPPYIKLADEGERDAPEPPAAASRKAGNKRRKKR